MRLKIFLVWALSCFSMGITYAQNYLCFTAMEDNSVVGISRVGDDIPNLEYSRDGVVWETITDGGVSLAQTNDKVYFRGVNESGFNKKCGEYPSCVFDNFTRFFVQGSVAASGSVMSLIDGEGSSLEIPSAYCFFGLFWDCEGLVQAPELPATILKEHCYYHMFVNSGIKEAPQLPATELEVGCYESMFDSCANLVKAPELPALTMKEDCYWGMFSACVNLAEAPALPSTTLAKECYASMFWSTGIAHAPQLPAMKLADRCYNSMFADCTSLVAPPELPALDLAERCYCCMFWGCTSLTQAPALPATKMQVECYMGMFNKCENLVVAPELPAMELDSACYFSMFHDCSRLEKAPVLPATRLRDKCYQSMFYGCKSLKEVPMLPADTFARSCYSLMFSYCENLSFIRVGTLTLDLLVHYGPTYNWVRDVLGEGMFIFPCGSTYDKKGASYVPINFTIVTTPIAIFENADGRVLMQDTIPCGAVPEYRGETPQKASDERFAYRFKGWDAPLQELTESGPVVFTAVYDSIALCDTVIHACGSFSINGRTLQRDSEWTDTIRHESGLDSILHYQVFIHHDEYRDSIATACDSFTWRGMVLRESTVWTERYQTVFGCDSVIQYTFNILHGVRRDTFIHTCIKPFVFHDSISYYKDTEFEDTLQAVSGCDSIIHYTLLFLNGVIVTEEHSACDSFVWKGMTITQDTLICDTTITREGCSWVECHDITIHHSMVKDTTIWSCGSFSWNGNLLTESGEVSDTFSTVWGCDSIVRSRIIIGETFLMDSFLTACETFEHAGRIFSDDTIWCDTFTTLQGCDSLVRYHLTILPRVERDSFITACETFEHAGRIFSDDTVWCDTFTSLQGCDSLVRYHLTILRGVARDSFITAMDAYVWNDIRYMEDAQWNDTLTTVSGCDSIIQYHLTLQYSPRIGEITLLDSLLIGRAGETLDVRFLLSQGEPISYEFKREGEAFSRGSIEVPNVAYLTIPSDLSAGEYAATLILCDKFGACSEKAFTFHVFEEDNLTESLYQKRWNDLVILQNEGKRFVSFQWYKNGKKLEGDTLQYYCDLGGLDGDYMVQVTDKQGRTFFIEPKHFDPELLNVFVEATPNPADKNEKITITIKGLDESQMDNARLVIYRTNGTVAWMRKPVQKETSLALPVGEYVVVLTVNDGKNINCKLIIK